MKHILTSIAALVLVGCGPQPPDTSIHQAATEGNIEAVKQHLAAGTDVNVNDHNDQGAYGRVTPLHCAANKETAELLIAKGADVNAKAGGVGDTPLHWSALRGQNEIAELLIANGADVNAKGFHGKTALDLAIQYKPVLFIDGERQVSVEETKYTELADLLRRHGGKTGEELKAAGN